MSSSEAETDISDSELEEYVDRCYLHLKEFGDTTVRFSDELFRCPYCPGKKKLVYAVKDLLQHATDVGKGSQNRDIKHKGKHLGLVRYIKTDLDGDDVSLEFSGLHLGKAPVHGMNELFVWPCMGVLASVDDKWSISTIKNELVKRGFDIARVRALSDGKYAVVEFKKDWSGFYNAIMFEKEFEVGHHGKKDYSSVSATLDGVYGWVARDDDYKSEGILGEFLQKNGDLKTLAAVEADEKRKTALLVANLNKTINELRMRIDELEGNNHATPGSP